MLAVATPGLHKGSIRLALALAERPPLRADFAASVQTYETCAYRNCATTFLNDLRAVGKTVFVHCRLGLNRSALLVGLMLIDEGYRAGDAIELMRRLRSPYVLENATFEPYLLSENAASRAKAGAAPHGG